MTESFLRIKQEIMAHPDNRAYTDQGWEPLFAGSSNAKIVIVGHAPGRKTQSAGLPWRDVSGDKLKTWLGLDESEFRSESIAQLPMDFYFQGKGKSGDLPPRKGFAPLWHPKLLKLMPDVCLFILVGAYAQGYYLGDIKKRTLAQTVRAYSDYLPKYFPIVHPSPLNIGWLKQNPWFESDVLPALKAWVRTVLTTN